MATRRRFLSWAMKSSMVAGWSSVQAGQQKPKFTVGFHSQAGPGDLKGAFQDVVGNPPQRVSFRVIPDISQKHIVAFRPFPSESGIGYGAVFELNFTGQQTLYMIMNTKQGEYLRAMVNGKPVDALVIDHSADAKYLVIWQGISAVTIEEMDKRFSRIGPGGVHEEPKGFMGKLKSKNRSLNDGYIPGSEMGGAANADPVPQFPEDYQLDPMSDPYGSPDLNQPIPGLE